MSPSLSVAVTGSPRFLLGRFVAPTFSTTAKIRIKLENSGGLLAERGAVARARERPVSTTSLLARTWSLIGRTAGQPERQWRWSRAHPDGPSIRSSLVPCR